MTLTLLLRPSTTPLENCFLAWKIVEDEFAMSAKGFGNFLHRLNPGAHGFLTPEAEIPAGPGGGVVVPEALEVFFEQIGTNGLQVIAEEVAQAELLLRSEIGFALQDAPTGLFEERFAAILGHLARLGGTYNVEGRIHLGYDVKTVDNVECL